MIIFLNGTLGVGKSSVANSLLWSVPQSVLLEGDALCNLNPFDAYDKTRIQTLTEILHFMVVKYRSIGFTRFIVDTIFEKADEVAHASGLLAPVDPDISHYLLVASDAKREANIRARHRENFLWELERSAELHGLLNAEFRNSPIVKTLDVTALGVAEAGEWILHDTAEHSHARSSP